MIAIHFGGLTLCHYILSVCLLIFISLMATLSDINVDTPGFFWLMFVYIFSHSLTCLVKTMIFNPLGQFLLFICCPVCDILLPQARQIKTGYFWNMYLLAACVTSKGFLTPLKIYIKRGYETDSKEEVYWKHDGGKERGRELDASRQHCNEEYCSLNCCQDQAFMGLGSSCRRKVDFFVFQVSAMSWHWVVHMQSEALCCPCSHCVRVATCAGTQWGSYSSA